MCISNLWVVFDRVSGFKLSLVNNFITNESSSWLLCLHRFSESFYHHAFKFATSHVQRVHDRLVALHQVKLIRPFYVRIEQRSVVVIVYGELAQIEHVSISKLPSLKHKMFSTKSTNDQPNITLTCLQIIMHLLKMNTYRLRILLSL